MSEEHSSESEESSTKNDSSSAYLWCDGRGREYVGEGGSEGAIVRLAKLTAVAEHGFDAVSEADHIHHHLYADDPDDNVDKIHVNAPRFLEPVDRDEHLTIHREGKWVKTDDGIPVLRSDEEPDDADEGGGPQPTERPTEVTA